ncbi:MAG: hypothetical protein JW885_03985 [Deltaproteobacteria bacterium]|nr:hypothetical protein [Candidatus Zymogenaceae bacterium]
MSKCDYRTEYLDLSTGNQKKYECPHSNLIIKDIDGKHRCIFHAQDEKKDIEIFKKEFEKLYESGKHNFVGFIFPEGFSFQQLKKQEESLVFENAEFAFAEFQCKADFSGVQFKGIIGTSFCLAEFLNNADFSYAHFLGKGKVSFFGAHFKGKGVTTFISTHFLCEGGTDFSSAVFEEKWGTLFDFAEFEGNGVIDFSHAIFSSKVRTSLVNAQFSSRGGVNFRGAYFDGKGYVDFSHAHFFGGGIVNFSGVHFIVEGGINFIDTKFYNNLSANFSRARFSSEEGINFSGAHFKSEKGTDFKEAYFSGKGKTDFSSAIILTINFEGTTFEKTTDFQDSRSVFLGFRNTYFEQNLLLRGSYLNEIYFNEIDISNIYLGGKFGGEYKPFAPKKTRDKIHFNDLRIFISLGLSEDFRPIGPALSSHKKADKEGGKDNWLQAQKDYLVIKEWFRLLADYEAEDEMLYWARRCEAKTKKFLGKCWFCILKNILGFGIRFKPVIISIISVILLSALLYFFAGLMGLLNYDSCEPVNFIDRLVNSLYLSFITYTTVGFGDISPLDGFRFVTMFEGIFGVILNAWLVAMLARRLFR